MPTKLLKREWLISIALVVLTLVVYWRVIGNSFINLDDGDYIINNSHVQEGFNWDSLKWAFTSIDAENWHPLTWMSHILDFQLYGPNASGHHLTSLIIHSANATLLFWALYLMTAAIWRSALVAALFALHPLNVESVAWVSERKNVLCMLFWILAVLAYSRYSQKPEWRRFLPVIALFALGLLSKPMVITLPFVLLLLDYWPLNRLQRGQAASDQSSDCQPQGKEAKLSRSAVSLALEKVPLFALAAASGVITVIAQRKSGAIKSTNAFPVRIRLENALSSYGAYLWKMIWPKDLSVFYPYPRSGIAFSQLVLSGTTVGAITVVVLWKIKHLKHLSVGWFWYTVTLIPVIGLVQVGGQAMADRYAYIPLIGVLMMLTWTAAAWSKSVRLKNPVIILTGISVLAVLATVTSTQVGHWKNTITLFEHAAAVTNNNHVAHGILGAALAKEGKLDAAVSELTKALEIDPSNYSAEHNLGMALLQRGEPTEAIEHFKKAVEIDPRSLDGYNTLGAALLDAGRLQDAIPCFLRILEISPNYPLAYANLGYAFDQQGRQDDAMAAYGKALELASCDSRPDACSLAAQINYRTGELFARMGQVTEAAEQFREALRLRPDYAEARHSLARVLSEVSR